MRRNTQKRIDRSLEIVGKKIGELRTSVSKSLTFCKAKIMQRIIRRTILDLKNVDTEIDDFIESEIAAARTREIPEHVIIGAIENLTKEYAQKNKAEAESPAAVNEVA